MRAVPGVPPEALALLARIWTGRAERHLGSPAALRLSLWLGFYYPTILECFPLRRYPHGTCQLSRIVSSSSQRCVPWGEYPQTEELLPWLSSDEVRLLEGSTTLMPYGEPAPSFQAQPSTDVVALVRQAATLLRATGVALWSMSDQGRWSFVSGFNLKPGERERVEIADGLPLQVFFRQDKTQQGLLRAPAGLRAYLMVPVPGDQSLVGYLYVERPP